MSAHAPIAAIPETPNIRVVTGPSGTAIIADARRPAPEFRDHIKALANPPLVSDRDSPEVAVAKRRCVAAFAKHQLWCDTCGGLADTDGCVSECVGFVPIKLVGKAVLA